MIVKISYRGNDIDNSAFILRKRHYTYKKKMKNNNITYLYT